MANQTKIYKNTTKRPMHVMGLGGILIGDIEAGEQLSVHGPYLPPVVMENYPGLVDVSAQEEEEAAAAAEKASKK